MRSPEDMRIIQIDVTNACVHTCSNCSRMCGHHKKPFFMDFETFKKAVDSLEGYEGTIGIMGGEPTIHPDFERFTRYLASKYPKKEGTSCLIEPTDDFIRNLKFEEQCVTEKYQEKAGSNARVTGPGLWSSIISKYGEYYELIQDSFAYQCVNDHSISCYHQPVMVCRKDLGVSDKEWIGLRDNCWMQMNWSASITPKGAFFCEVAAALDMLFDGPGGWPIEPGWWKRKPEDFAGQLHWCEWCGLALETRSRDANEGIDDVSETFLERLKTVDSPKLRKGLVNVYHKDESEDKSLIRHNQYHDKEQNRIGAGNASIYPKTFQLIVEGYMESATEDFLATLNSARGQFEKIIAIAGRSGKGDVLKETVESQGYGNVDVWDYDEPLGKSLARANVVFGKHAYVVCVTAGAKFKAGFTEMMKRYVLNPGTILSYMSGGMFVYDDLGILEYDKKMVSSLYIYNTSAEAIQGRGITELETETNFDGVKLLWDKHKRITINKDLMTGAKIRNKATVVPGMRYAVYGAGDFGRKARDIIAREGAKIAFYVDSDEEKWGGTYLGHDIVSPDGAAKRRDEFDKVMIAALAYGEIKRTLFKNGFMDDDIAWPLYFLEETWSA